MPSSKNSIFLALFISMNILALGSIQQIWNGKPIAQASRLLAQPQAELVWQGKLLPIVTDVFSSLGKLNTALSNHDIDSIAAIGNQFAAEQGQFEAVTPIPTADRTIARVMNQGLRNLANGAKALVIGLRSSDSTAARRAANQIEQGEKQFQQALDQIKRAAEAASPANTSTTPSPTPIIKGLP